jgi:hypothetical protein
MIKTKVFVITLFIIFPFLIPVSIESFMTTNTGKVSLAIFPFNDVQQNSLNMDIPGVLHAEFSKYEFIEIVPVEIIREKVYEIEPQALWTGRRGMQNRGGILWSIEPRIIEKVNETVAAQISVYGDLIRSGHTWSIDAFLIKNNKIGPQKTFKLSGTKDEEIPAKLAEMSKVIAEWIRKGNVLKEAEEDMRSYMGGMYAYQTVIEKMKNHVNTNPESIPVRGLLLELYLKEKENHEEEIIREGMKIIDLLKQGDDEGMRYLLSINIDPFDAVAGIYEGRGNREKAIEIRKSALELFPFNSEMHKKKIGKN